MNTFVNLKLLKMKKLNKITTTGDYNYVYDPGYLEKKCIEKLSTVVAEFLTTMSYNAELCRLKKDIEKLNKKHNGDNYDAC